MHKYVGVCPYLGFCVQAVELVSKLKHVMPHTAEDVNSIAWFSHAAVISDANTTLLVERFAADLGLQTPQQDTMPQAKSSTSGYALKDLLGLQTHSK